MYFSLARASARGLVDSRRLLVLRCIGELALVAAEAGAPLLLASRYGSVAGWSGAQACVLIGLARAGQGMAYTFGRGLEPTEFSQTLRTGRFDQVLVQPVSPLGWHLTNDIQLRFGFRVAGGIALAIAGASAAGVHWTVGRAAAALIAVVSSTALIVAILIAGAALTFFTTEGSEVALLLADGGLGLVSFPLDLYGSVLRFVFTFVIPAGLCVYVPALVIVGRHGAGSIGPRLLWVLPAVLAAVAGASLWFWRAGLRRYRSTGS